MRALTSWVLRHRLVVAVSWLAVAVAGAVTAPITADRLSYEFALPGQPAYEANEKFVATYGFGGSEDPVMFVAQGEAADEVARRAASAASQAVPGLGTITSVDAGAESLHPDGSDVSMAILYPPVDAGPEPYASSLGRLEAIATEASSTDVEVELTGFSVLAEGTGGDRSVLVEVLLGGVGALVILVLVFASLLAGVPLVVAAVSILGTFLALLGLTAITDVTFVVQYLVALIGLGVAIDYSLLVVTRWREERASGSGNDVAISTAMQTAGRSVLFSGVTVAVSLSALVLVPLPFLQSIGLGGLLIPLFSVATSLTLVPALLSAVGPRLQWPRGNAGTTRSRAWERIANGVLAHRWLTVVATSVLLLAMAAPVLTLSLGTPQLSGLSASSPAAYAANRALDAGVPVGVFRPTTVSVSDEDADVAVNDLEGIGGVASVVAPKSQQWTHDGSRLLTVWTTDDPATAQARDTLATIRSSDIGEVGGSPAEDADFVSAVYGNILWVILVVAGVTFLLLAHALRSLWLPVKALVLNVLSIAAAYGVTVLIWQEGYGSELLFGVQASGVITTWVPIAAFAFLFGLSMDYEVFILSRMRESYDEHHDTDRAVVDGIANTGRLVTSAALILFLSFVALSTVPSAEVKILATTLAIGILIDAVIVRGLLAPALVAVLGHLNWTMPTWLRKAVRVKQ